MSRGDRLALVGVGMALVAWIVPEFWKTVPTYLSYPLLGIGVLLVIVGLWPTLISSVRRSSANAASSIDGQIPSTEDFQEFTSVYDAVRLAMSECEGTLWWTAARKWIANANSEDDQLKQVAGMLAVDVKPYGKPPLSNKREPIEEFTWNLGLLTHQGAFLRKRDHPEIVLYSELAFKTQELMRALDDIKSHKKY